MADAKKTSTRSPGRPRKAVGLSQPSLKQVPDGVTLRDMRQPSERHAGSVLPDPRPSAPAAPGVDRVFAAPGNLDGGRPATTDQPQAIPDAAPRTQPDDDLGLTGWLRQIIREVAADEHQEVSNGRLMTNAEALARKLLDRALREDKVAMEMVADRIEGKAVRAAQVNAVDKTVEDQLDHLDNARLDDLAKGN